MFLAKKKEILEIRVISKDENGLFTVEDVDTKKIIEEVHKNDLCKTYEEAELSQKEIQIKSEFRKSRRNKKGECKCAWCGMRGTDLTIDHINSLDSFGGKVAIRKDYDTWKRAWSTRNLQMLCEDCNKNKSNLVNDEGDYPLRSIDFRARILNNKKIIVKSVNKNSPISKVGYGIATGKWAKNKKELAEYVARSDSRIIRRDVIFNSTEAYDMLPSTI